ncbi:hypothetical protein [Mesorhizobium sp. B2-3-15]|uniref:hypothetical protein n=1 Tax=Mesorhizobium sp. B2-3-15 TaxID=2589949 RepID=UPI001128DF30|nr:hypothetical protein [Mesorhizobium sp. B2-3-15]TPL75961.1 hypothetical protein FJ954_05960 [Mesorhizobium sp. B2-3-15]
MAKSAAERKRNQIERQREQERLLPDSTYSFLREPFYAWLERTGAGGDWGSAMQHLDMAALPEPDFVDDRGPYSRRGEFERDSNYDPYEGFEGSIGRAESMVDNLIAAAAGMAMVINRYKQEELQKRISEIERSDLSDPEVRKKALADIVRLKTMMDRLQDKMIRVSIYQWKIKGA